MTLPSYTIITSFSFCLSVCLSFCLFLLFSLHVLLEMIRYPYRKLHTSACMCKKVLRSLKRSIVSHFFTRQMEILVKYVRELYKNVFCSSKYEFTIPTLDQFFFIIINDLLDFKYAYL